MINHYADLLKERLRRVGDKMARRTRENPGFYVAGRHIPIRAIRAISDDRVIDVDQHYLTRIQTA